MGWALVFWQPNNNLDDLSSNIVTAIEIMAIAIPILVIINQVLNLFNSLSLFSEY
ncbi:MAG: hypothetical protein AAFQ80_14355 [Cyanobacteria bacterium J06621_8]